MRRIAGVLAVLTIVLAGATVAQAKTSVVEVQLSDAATQVALLDSLGLDVTHDVTAERADVIAYGADDLALLRANGFTWKVKHDDLGALLRSYRAQDALNATQASALPSGRSTYRVYEDYAKEMRDLALAHPGLIREITLPKRSVEGRELRGLEITQNVNAPNDGRPVFVLVGLHHAREWPSAEINLEFAYTLAKEYGTTTSRGTRITNLLNNARVFIVPMINPDGFVVSRGGLQSDNPVFSDVYPTASGAMKRKNCAADTPIEEGRPCTERAGVDLNRNYGAFWGGSGSDSDFDSETYRGPGPWSEPETQAVHEWTAGLQVNTLITMHNVAGLVLRPPGASSQGLANDEARLKLLGDKMGATTGYTSQYGWQLYDTHGTTEDWNYSAQGAFGYTIELGGSSFQDPYTQGVVNQYLVGKKSGGRGAREALLLAAEHALDTTDHSVIEGDAPAGATLRLKKTFKTATDPVCTVSFSGVCAAPLSPIEVDDVLNTTMTVPESGHYVWHVNPSTRPALAKAGATESWTLTCESATGQVLETKTVKVARGEQVTENLSCAG
jgi:carboxypeptidase T